MCKGHEKQAVHTNTMKCSKYMWSMLMNINTLHPCHTKCTGTSYSGTLTRQEKNVNAAVFLLKFCIKIHFHFQLLLNCDHPTWLLPLQSDPATLPRGHIGGNEEKRKIQIELYKGERRREGNSLVTKRDVTDGYLSKRERQPRCSFWSLCEGKLLQWHAGCHFTGCAPPVLLDLRALKSICFS